MGWVRVILAFSVVGAHGRFAFSVDSVIAVQIFYMISGFLMSYILVENTRYATAWQFYLSRAMRIFPLYYVVAICAVIVYVAGEHSFWYGTFRDLPGEALLLLVWSNITIFFQDLTYFATVNDGVFSFSGDYRNSDRILSRGLIVPQAWTLGIELMFYLIAPFVLKSWPRILLLLVLSLGLRLIFVISGFGLADPWMHRFAATEMALFLLGAVSHRVLLSRVRNWFLSARLISTLSFTYIFFLLLNPVFWPNLGSNMHLNFVINYIIVIAFTFVILPVLFEFQSLNQLDRKMGELSYPIYVGHILVMYSMSLVYHRDGTIMDKIFDLFTIGAIILVAYLLNKFVAQPLELYRRRLKAETGTFQ